MKDIPGGGELQQSVFRAELSKYMKEETMHKVTVIAEAGVNHNGDLELAKRLAKAAKDSGADIVKFQTAKLEALVTKTAPMAEYQKQNTMRDEAQLEMLKKLLLSYDEFVELADYCKEIDIRFLSTPFDLDSIDFLAGIGSNLWKIPSGEITNYPYLVKIAGLHQPIILSTGMSTLEEVEDAVELLQSHGADKLILLHCTSQYPAPIEDVNLRAMLALRDRFHMDVGYSDHTTGIEVPMAAVALGASVIEKHFTLDRNLEGPDHKASLKPHELRAMVEGIRKIERSLGNGIKQVADSERNNLKTARKSIVAARAIKKGEVFTEQNLTTKRPGTGISPMQWNGIIGTKADRDYNVDDLI